MSTNFDTPKIKVFGLGDFGTHVVKAVQSKMPANMQTFSLPSKETLEKEAVLDKMSDGNLLLFVEDREEDADGSWASLLATYAKEAGLLTVGWVKCGSLDTMEDANASFKDLLQCTDSIILVSKENHAAEAMIAEGIQYIGGITDDSKGIALMLADMEEVFSNGGLAHISYGEANGEHDIVEATKRAANTMFLGKTLSHAKKVLLMQMIGDGRKSNRESRRSHGRNRLQLGKYRHNRPLNGWVRSPKCRGCSYHHHRYTV